MQTVTVLHAFFLFMVLFPEAQRKAQKELDEVVGPTRLPEFEDRPNLPYINALCKEVMRWHPIVPLGIAHRVTQDDVYGGYLIPKGSLVLGNAWYSTICPSQLLQLIHFKTGICFTTRQYMARKLTNSSPNAFLIRE